MFLTQDVNVYKMQHTSTLIFVIFGNRIVAIWNSLPNIVSSGESTNTFKLVWTSSWLIGILNLIGMPSLPELEVV